ncbi:RNA polymerase sigma factor [Larkinella arboricola]|uniref:RNA polymerase sigma-70 factor (ECF subfamily) n=1 Tax=Larkinella arboricola TaxID=643671 RepID=A0A327X9B9_LARAB|nr:sigma-70 family RNA polymerase sigma factor [Larkinella arboricola]RAK02684.1 RNA polymerase sigma-70 factor (ECF subfamily) [Larkinella arboricola]
MKRSLPDSDLWEEVRMGDEPAFEELIRRFYRPLYHYGLKFTRDIDLLKDGIQDLFVELWTYRRNITQTEYVRVYLFKSLRRKLHKSALRNGLAEPLEEDFSDDFFYAESFEDELIRTELSTYQRSRLEALLKTLTDRQQEAIHLKFFAALPNEKIAEVMGLNYQSVGNLLHRAVNKLREGWHRLL